MRYSWLGYTGRHRHHDNQIWSHARRERFDLLMSLRKSTEMERARKHLKEWEKETKGKVEKELELMNENWSFHSLLLVVSPTGKMRALIIYIPFGRERKTRKMMIPENERVVIKLLSQPLIPRSLTLTKRPQENLRRKQRYQHNDISKHYTLLCPKHLFHLFESNSTKDDEGKGRENIHYLSSPKGMKIVWIVLPHHQQVYDGRRKLIFLWRKESRVMNVWDVMYWSLVTSSLSRLLFRRGRRSKIFVSSPSPPFTSTIVNLAMCTFLSRPKRRRLTGLF